MGPSAGTAVAQDVEEAVQGCLQRSLWDLWGCVGWGLLDRSFAEEQERCLYDQAAAELLADKRLCLQLAREHGLGEEYARSVRVRALHSRPQAGSQRAPWPCRRAPCA